MHVFHEDTLWADDLYMSVPFLCRYFELTGDARYIDDAARQFLGFRKMLFLPKKKLMSHVYDIARGMPTGIPWGRGNGWVLFSLSELLAVLPQNHALRGDVLAMYRELCAGVLAQQDEAGMWHQVLDEHDAYPETSCTAMFSYAFSRGVQHGWLAEPEKYIRAVFKGWEALNRTSIDRLGNVHGVCRGSEFSFTSDYYKRDLLWNLNDTHGIGIVLLAGVEVHRLTQFLQSQGETNAAAIPGKTRKSAK
jgi:rhamnogalacturonyl hydrolase YesR